MHSTNEFVIVDKSEAQDFRGKLLGGAIPAISFAAGRNELGNPKANINYEEMKNKKLEWPRSKGKWLHSDIKNIAYIFVRKLFNKIAAKDENKGGK